MSVCWHRVATLAETPPGSCRTVRAGGRALALVNDGGEIRALDDTCPHEGGSLGRGTVHRGQLICPLHAWVFDVRTGTCRGMPGVAVSCYATRIRGGAIEVEIPREETGAT